MSMTDTRARGRSGRHARGELTWNGKRWQRWNGRRWVSAAYSIQKSRLEDPTPLHRDDELADDVRDRVLALAVEDQVLTNGATVVHEGPSGLVLSYGRRVNHVAHAVMTLLTGVWLLVWIAVVANARPDRVLLEVDPWGHVWVTRSPRR